MTANTSPIFVRIPRNESISVITGQTASDGTGSTELFQADTNNGSRIHAISGVFVGTVSTQSVLRLFLESSGTYRIITEIVLPTYTQSAGVASPVISVLDYAYSEFLDPADRYLTLDEGDALYAAVYTTIESALHLTAWGGDY